MKSMLSVLLLSLPLSVLASELKLEDFKGQYANLSDNRKCLNKIVIDVYKNRLRIYDITSGSHVLNREIHNERVKISDVLIEGSLEDKTLTEKRYKLKRVAGVVLDKNLIAEVKVEKGEDSITFVEGSESCKFGTDLPEVIPAPEGEKPEVIQEAGGITDPASTHIVLLKRHFKSGDELLDVAHSDDVLKKIIKIKAATRDYHGDLIELIKKKESLNAEEIALALQLPYFTAKDAKAIEAKIKEIRAIEPLDTKLLNILSQNANVADSFGSIYQQELALLLDKKIEKISVDELKLILAETFSGNSEVLVKELLVRMKDLSLEDKKSLIPDLEKVEAIGTAAAFAVEIIKEEHKDFSTDELLSNPLALNGKTQLKVIETLGKAVSDPSLENFDKLAVALRGSASALSEVARVFLLKIPVTAPQDILSMVSKLTNGSYDYEAYKDEFLLAAANQVKPLTVADADQLLKKMGYEVKRLQLLDKLMLKLTEDLTVDGFETLVKNIKNGYYDYEQYRDQALLKHYTKIQQTESQDNLKLLDLVNSQSSRKSLALSMYGRDSTKTLADVIALSQKVKNGYYDYEDYRDQILVEGVKALSSLSVADMKLLEDNLSSNAKRLSQLKINVNKLPGLSVADLQVLVGIITNGYYDYENYKDQALLVLLPKTSVTTQNDVTTLMNISKALGPKRAVLAVGLKLTFSITDLTLLVTKESDSTLKLEMIKGLAHKIAPLSALELVTLIASVKNGYYDYENMKFQALNFLLDHVKFSQVGELKLIMEQRSDAVSRLAIHKKLKFQLGAVTAQNLLVLADLIANGYYDYEQYKDDLILSESKMIASLTLEELLKLTDKVASAAKDKTLIMQMAARLPGFSDGDLLVLLNKIKNGYYDYEQHRDDTAIALAPIVKSISTDGINAVIKTIGNAKRKKVALILLAKKETVSKDDVLSISQNIANGSYDYENYKTQFLAEAISLIK